jgi:hypothetical protein
MSAMGFSFDSNDQIVELRILQHPRAIRRFANPQSAIRNPQSVIRNP